MCKEYYQIEGFIIFSEIMLKGMNSSVKKAKKEHEEDIFDVGSRTKYLVLKQERNKLIKVIDAAKRRKFQLEIIMSN